MHILVVEVERASSILLVASRSQGGPDIIHEGRCSASIIKNGQVDQQIRYLWLRYTFARKQNRCFEPICCYLDLTGRVARIRSLKLIGYLKEHYSPQSSSSSPGKSSKSRF